MVAPVFETYAEMILDVEFTPSSGVYTKVCGLMDVTITRTANVDEDEVPADCDDETLPYETDISVRSIAVSVSATGKWARSSQGLLKNWMYSGTPLNIRLRDTAAANGDTEIESGPAILTTLTNSRTKGQSVSAEIELRFKGVPDRTAAS